MKNSEAISLVVLLGIAGMFFLLGATVSSAKDAKNVTCPKELKITYVGGSFGGDDNKQYVGTDNGLTTGYIYDMAKHSHLPYRGQKVCITELSPI